MVELLNACFPFQTTEEQYHQAVRDWNLKHCLFQPSSYLGWLGVRPGRGWLCYIAVAPGLRGQGRGGQLCQALIDLARGLGLARLQLEVRAAGAKEDPIVAERVYARLGFVRRQKLSLWQGPGGPPADSLANTSWADCRPRWQARDSFLNLPWQREAQSLADSQACYEDGHGCIVFSRSGGILHILGSPQVSLPGGWRMNNLLEQEPCLDYLVSQQGHICGHQWEMELKLS